METALILLLLTLHHVLMTEGSVTPKTHGVIPRTQIHCTEEQVFFTAVTAFQPGIV